MDKRKQKTLNPTTNISEAMSKDEIAYRLFVRDKVRKAREVVRRGETISIEELESEMKSW